jgi:molecular chaperone DnaK (HSP70)
VDSLFLSFLKDLIPDPKHRHLFSNSKVARLKVLEVWERMKQRFDSSDPGRNYVLFDGACMVDFFEDHSVDLNLRACIQECNAERARAGLPAIGMKGERRLLLPSEQVKKFFKPCIDSIVEALSGYVEGTMASSSEERVNVILAGGFSKSPFLQSEVRAAFPNCNFILLNNPDLAIVIGAARFGTRKMLGEDVVTARVIARSYAVESAVEYNVHNKEHKRRETSAYIVEGTKYIDRMHMLVKRGQTVECDARNPRHGPFFPLTTKQNAISFNIFSSDRDSISDRDEDHATQRCSVDVDVDTSKPYDDRMYYCELCFGGTEIQCLVYESKDERASSVSSGTFSYE